MMTYYMVEQGEGTHDFSSFLGYTKSKYIADMLIDQTNDVEYFVYEYQFDTFYDVADFMYNQYYIDVCNCEEDLEHYELKIMESEGLLSNLAVIGSDDLLLHFMDYDYELITEPLHTLKKCIYNLRLISGYFNSLDEYNNLILYLYIYMLRYKDRYSLSYNDHYLELILDDDAGCKLDPVYIFGFIHNLLPRIQSAIIGKE